MALIVHRDVRTDALAYGLAELLTAGPMDPFAPELVAVPTRGIERFLAQRLSLRLGAEHGATDGVCANVTFVSPAELTAMARGADPGGGPWDPRSATWPVLAVLDEVLDDEWAAPLARYLREPDGTASGGGRRFALARKVARLFWQYGTERPEMIESWAAEADEDGADGPVPADLAWQPALWRKVRARLAVPSPGEALAEDCLSLAREPGRVSLPARVSVFGPSRLPAAHLTVLRTLALARDVHLWLPDPSPRRWRHLAEASARPTLRSDSPADALTRNPLLRALGRDSAELVLTLGADAPAEDDRPPGAAQQHLLEWVQQDIRADRPPDPAGRVVDPGDRSVQLHACHGRPRQVEVLREVILGLLSADPTLEPRDILIMCPDVSTYAPLITASFDATRDRGTVDLRVRVADRTPEQHNAVLAVLDALLRIAAGRAEASAILDFAALPPVTGRFDLDPDTLERLRSLAAVAGIRWGFDESDHRRFRLPVAQNTWRAGVDRMLLGVAMSEDDLTAFGDVLPLADVDDSDIATVGSLAQLIGALADVCRDLRGRRSLRAWMDLLADALVTVTDPQGADSWQLPAALGVLAAETERAGADAEVLLDLPDIRLILADVLAGRPTRTNFRTGGVTVCSMVPMRSVPHRVICLLGLDDGTYPRRTVPDGDDVSARRPHIGERDATAEDRQLFLDAIMAATQHLVITYTGADLRTNQRREPCVPVAELLETLDRTAVTTDGAPLRDRILVSHPLQPFDPRNFVAGALGSPEPFSHDHEALAGAIALGRPKREAVGIVPAALVADPPREVTIEELCRFLTNPAAYFLRERLGLRLRDEDDTPPDRVPIAVGGLDRWRIGERILQQDLRGYDGALIARAEFLRGELPPGALGRSAFDGILNEVSPISRLVRTWRDGTGREIPVNLTLADGTRVTGLVPDVYGSSIATATFTRLREKHDLALWVRLLAVSATLGTRGHARQAGRERAVHLELPEWVDPAASLAELVDLLTRGLRSPLPVTPVTAQRYARCREFNDPAASLEEARKAWQPGRAGTDAADESVAAVWGSSFETLLDTPPAADEQLWFPDDPSRFAVIARRIWHPLLKGRQVLK